jgi:hypothetical protein
MILSLGLTAAPQISSQPANNLDYSSAKNARKETWESVGFHPAGARDRLPNRLSLFEFSEFSAVKLF